jgi:hypothetical protein
MPATSQKQRAFLNMRFGHAWVRRHHFANRGKLPTYAPGSQAGRRAAARKALKGG